ncbi:MAG: sigma-70 family RNA polymerase sigma factor [Bacteroidota bacterium]
MDKVQHVVDQLYRNHFGKMVATLLYCSRDIDPDTAEDIVHDSFSEALVQWRLKGIPLNTNGWIYTVCRNKALNKIKKDKHLTFNSSEESHEGADLKFSESLIDDYQLKLLFACANPALAPKTQVVITLKYVVNLKIEAIASVLGMTIDGVDKVLARARQKIKNESILLEEPNVDAWMPRVPVVHKVIYLIFNEGYKSSSGKEIIRKELCEEALILNKALLDSDIGTKETAALHSLMLFNCSRFDSRFDTHGDIVELEKQDRSLWNKDLIALGHEFLRRSEDINLTSYHFEASIAYVHCIAADFKSTNWKLISKLYERLLERHPNPFVELNYAIALYYSGNKKKAFDILHQLRQHSYMSEYFILNSALGKFYYLDRDYSLSKKFFTIALKQTQSKAEKKLIERHILAVESEGKTNAA